MSRTYRNKYVPLYSAESLESIEATKAYSVFYAKNGRGPDGLKYYTTNYRHKSGCAFIRFDNSLNRDGNKAHGDLSAMMNIAVKKISSKVRVKLRQELRRMKAGVIGWDENIHNINKIRAHERAMRLYDVD